jgi:hypothetical protein
MREGLKLGDCSHARHRVHLGSTAKMKNVCLDTSVLIERVRGLGGVVVSRRRCTVLIGLEIGYRGSLVIVVHWLSWFIGSLVRKFVRV